MGGWRGREARGEEEEEEGTHSTERERREGPILRAQTRNARPTRGRKEGEAAAAPCQIFFFTLSITPGDAPLCINSSTIAAQFRAAAQCIAVEPSKEIALQFAPSLIKRDTSLMSPFDAA